MEPPPLIVSMDKNVTFHFINIPFQRKVQTMDGNKHSRYTKVGTNIEEVKRLNSQSGLSYNEVKKLLALNYLQNK